MNIDMQGNWQREFRFVIDRLFMTVMHGLAQGSIGYWQAVNMILGRISRLCRSSLVSGADPILRCRLGVMIHTWRWAGRMNA